MEYIANLPHKTVELIGALTFLALLGIIIVNIYARMWVWLRIALNAFLIALPLLAVELLSDAAGYAKLGLPEQRWVYISSHEVANDIFYIVAQEIKTDSEGYDLEAKDPRLYVAFITDPRSKAALRKMQGLRERGGVPVAQDADGEGIHGGGHYTLEVTRWRLPPKSER